MNGGRRSTSSWTAALAAELDRRIALQVAQLRDAGELGLRSLVITDGEVDRLLDPQRRPHDETSPPGSLWALLRRDAAPPSIARLQQRFGLSPFELDVLLACLVLDIDRRFERLFAYLNDDLTRPRPSADVLLRLLAPPLQRLALQGAFGHDGRLLCCALLVTDSAPRAAQGELYRVGEGVVRELLGRGGLDARVARVRFDDDAPTLAPALWQQLVRPPALQALLAAGGACVIGLYGRSGSGRRHLVEQACAELSRACHVLDGRRLERLGSELEPALLASLRDAHLAGAALLLHHADSLFAEADRAADLCALLRPWLREFGVALLFGAEQALPLPTWFCATTVAEIELNAPATTEREAAWLQVLDAVAAPLDGVGRDALAQSLAARFRMNHGEIAAAAQQTRQLPPGDDAVAWARSLHAHVARISAPRLHRLAVAMPTQHTLADLVLPADKLELLADLVRRVRHRRQVFEQWSFDAVSSRGRGLVALFHGASGTGKTMAADALANALQMQLFRIDLAGVVSKYIGETEKNLRAIFDEADRSDAVLFFDEADALFGKRSEVKDAHDRYANIEINYLLQRIELFDGVAVLATNKRSHLDDAFLRRIHVSVEFPLPRAAERGRLWDRSFPAAAPLADDIDWDFLGQRFELSGGTIRNAALGAAFLAAETEQRIGMREVVNALRNELVKAGRRVTDGDFAAHAALLGTTPPATPRPRRARARSTVEEIPWPAD